MAIGNAGVDGLSSPAKESERYAVYSVRGGCVGGRVHVLQMTNLHCPILFLDEDAVPWGNVRSLAELNAHFRCNIRLKMNGQPNGLWWPMSFQKSTVLQ